MTDGSALAHTAAQIIASIDAHFARYGAAAITVAQMKAHRQTLTCEHCRHVQQRAAETRALVYGAGR